MKSLSVILDISEFWQLVKYIQSVCGFVKCPHWNWTTEIIQWIRGRSYLSSGGLEEISSQETTWLFVWRVSSCCCVLQSVSLHFAYVSCTWDELGQVCKISHDTWTHCDRNQWLLSLVLWFPKYPKQVSACCFGFMSISAVWPECYFCQHPCMNSLPGKCSAANIWVSARRGMGFNCDAFSMPQRKYPCPTRRDQI